MDIQEIKNRIKSRRNSGSQTSSSFIAKEKSTSSTRVERKRRGRFSRLLTSLMILLSFALGGMIYMRKDEKGTFLSKTFNINVNFANVNKNIGNFLDKTLNFDIFNYKSKTATVSSEPIYTNVSGNFYTSGSNAVYSISAGVVVYSGIVNGNPTIIVEHDQGFVATYSGLEELLVERLDRVLYKDPIGVVSEEVKILFSKDGQKISYEEVLQLIK